MPLLDFMHGRRSFVTGGRVYQIGRPTVETVFRLLRLFPREIGACETAMAGKEVNLLDVLPVFVRHADRFAEVLETCVSGDGPPSSWPLDALAREVLRDCDSDRIVSEFRAGEPDPDVVPREVSGESLEDVAFCQIAQFYHVSPMELARWPFEAYLSARDAAGRIISGDTKPKKWFNATPTGEPGVSVM